MTDSRELSTGDSVVHALNLDLPHENLRYAQRARQLGLPFALSTISHPWAGIEQMYQNGDDRFFEALRKCGIGADMAWGVREVLKLSLRKQRFSGGALRPFRTLQQDLLSLCDVIFPLSPDEADSLTSAFHVPCDIAIIPNGFTFDEDVRRNQTFEHELVSVGRIEPRKNSLNLAKACHEAGVNIAFVGGQNRNHRRFVSEFMDIVESSGYVRYLGAGGPEHVAEALRASAVYINAAWFEVVSQSDLEAAGLGLPVLTTVHSHMGSLLGSNSQVVQPEALAGRGRARYLREVMAHAKTTDGVPKQSWMSAALGLDLAYSALMERSRS